MTYFDIGQRLRVFSRTSIAVTVLVLVTSFASFVGPLTHWVSVPVVWLISFVVIPWCASKDAARYHTLVPVTEHDVRDMGDDEFDAYVTQLDRSRGDA